MSFLERCPQFRGVLIEGFHCTHKAYKMCCITTNMCIVVHVKSIVPVSQALCSALSVTAVMVACEMEPLLAV